MGVWDRLKELDRSVADPAKDPSRWWWGLAFIPLAFLVTLVAIFDNRAELLAYFLWTAAAFNAYMRATTSDGMKNSIEPRPPEAVCAVQYLFEYPSV